MDVCKLGMGQEFMDSDLTTKLGIYFDSSKFFLLSFSIWYTSNSETKNYDFSKNYCHKKHK